MAFRIFHRAEEIPSPPLRAVLAIGNFDGVHRGHQRLLRMLVNEARARNGTAVVLTFDPHPRKILAPEKAPPLLTTLDQRISFFREAGVDIVLILPFTTSFSRLSPEEFVRRIVQQRLGAERVLVGKNFRFGHGKAGTVAELLKLSKRFGFSLAVVPPVSVAGRLVSSSRIRSLLAEGRLEQAAKLLGHPFALTGTSEPGVGRGRPLGFPTLNFIPEQECLPARGVYVTEALIAGKAYASATNVGVRPTFGGQRLVVESHLLNFSKQVRNARLEVRFLARLRKEKKFPSAEALRVQIERDVERTRRYFAGRGKAGIRHADAVPAAD